MDRNAFSKKYPALSAEIVGFQYADSRTDEKIIRRLIVNKERNPTNIRISTAAKIVKESGDLLDNFDSDWEMFTDAANCNDSKDAARAWLETLNSLWSRTLRELKLMPPD